MSTRVESESYNPLAEFFEHEHQFEHEHEHEHEHELEHEDQEDEARRGRRSPRMRNRSNYAKRSARFLSPRMFRRQFVRPFPRPKPRPRFPFPRPFPFPMPQQPSAQGTPPPESAAAPPPVSDSWDPPVAVAEPAVQPSPDTNGQSGTEPGDGDTPPATDVQQPGGDEEFFEFGAYEHESPGKRPSTITIPPTVICGGKPYASLDNFLFGKPTLRKDATRNHPAQIDAIAREIRNRGARRKPVPTVCIVGRTDVVGAQNYNYTLGLLRAKSVREALCKALGAYARNLTFVVYSLGEKDPTPRGTTPAARARNRRVDVYLLSKRTAGEKCGPNGGRRPPRAKAGCGVPVTSPQREMEIAQELEQFEQFEQPAPAKRVSVQPKLCLYQAASKTSHRNHFQHQALGTARRIGAIGSPDVSNCTRRIGATPYSTGADIINAIRAGWQCAGKKPLRSVHIFGHSGSDGAYGTASGTGLYQNSRSLDAAARAAGARTISDIPTNILASDVIFVLHGCNQASPCKAQGNDANFAQSLLQHLSGSLTNPRVYGHYNSGCAGRDNSWCLYSKSIPKGTNSRPDYTDPGGCATPSREVEIEVEMEQEQEKGSCDTIERFAIDDYGRGVSQLSTSQQGKMSQIKNAIRKRARRCGGISIVEVRGHSSTEGPAGRNRNLAQVRANVVKGALGVTVRGARVFATSKGEEQPVITPDNTDQKQRKNRRVEIFVM